VLAGRIAAGLGLAAGYPQGNPPGAGVPGSLSGSWQSLGHIPLVPSQGVARSATYRQVYLTNPWVWAAVNMIARAVARAPMYVYGLDAKGRKERIRGDVPMPPGRPPSGALLDRFLAQPTPGLSRRAVVQATLADRLLYGNGLWELLRLGGQGFPASARRWPWQQVARVHEDAAEPGKVLWYELRAKDPATGQPRRLLPVDVVHFGLGSDSEGPTGVSPLEACRHTLALHEALVRHLIAYFANSARPSGHVKVDRLTREKATEIRQLIAELYASPENAGRVLVTAGDWQPMGDSPDHAQIVELVRLSREEIAAIYAVPPPVLGILEQAIKSNVKELREQYVRDSVGPWASEFEEELQAQLLAPMPAWASLHVRCQLAEQLRPDLEARALVYQRLAAYLAIDEVRALEDMRPLDIEGVTDVPWVASGAQPLSAWQAGRTRRPPPPGGAAATEEELLLARALAAASNGHDEEEPW